MQRQLRPVLAAAVAIVLATALAACGDPTAPPPRDPGAGTAAAPEVVEGYAGDVLLSIHGSGGSGAPGRPVPDVEVRTDGTVFLGTDTGLGVDTFTLTEAGLDQVRKRFATVSLRQGDYAESDWTDQPETTVFSTLGGRPEAIRVYGFRHDDDVEDDDWERLEEAIGLLDDLAKQTTADKNVATPRSAYRPAEVALRLRPVDDSSGEVWPFSRALHRTDLLWTPDEAACVLLTGRDIITLEAMAADHGSDLVWATASPHSGLPGAVAAEIDPILRGSPAPCTSEPTAGLGVGRFHDAALGDPAAWAGLAATDRWRRPTPFDLLTSADAVLGAAEGVTGLDADRGELSSYETRWIVGSAGPATYVEVHGTYPEPYRDDNPDFPVTWQVRVDLATGTAVAAEVDGEPVGVS